MNADITRTTFDRRRHRASVVMQQGRVQLDADWNEQADITRYRHEQLGNDAIGPTGAPKSSAGGGFAISVAPGGTDLLVSPGRIYVDGILCENTPTAIGAVVVSATTFTVDQLVVDELALAAGQLVRIAVGAATIGPLAITNVNGLTRLVTVASAVAGAVAGNRVTVARAPSLHAQPHSRATFTFGGAAGALAPGRYAVGLDVWLRERTVLDDPSIREPALNGIDTATRLQVVWKAALFRLGNAGQGDCSTPVPGFPPTPGTGRLLARAASGAADPNPCILPDVGGYRGLEHQLYRVEVHRVIGNDVVLKWQRDNAAMVSTIDAVGTTFRVADVGRDDVAGFSESGFVELTDEALVLANSAGDLLAVATIDRALGEITIDTTVVGPHVETAPTRASNNHFPRARRWDGRLVATTTNPQWVGLEHGVQVQITAGTFREGDYWLIPARTATAVDPGTIEWPRADDGTPLAQRPAGVVHHSCKLAMVDVTAAGFATGAGTLIDCRPQFPALTAIQASDVGVDPTPCGFTDVHTVQEAIDELCGRGGGTCTRTAQPGATWATVFDGLAGDDDAEICLPVGQFPLTAPVILTGTGGGHLTLHGAGWGSEITAAGLDHALEFRGWGSVTVRDLAIETGIGGQRPRPNPQPGLRGALSFEECGHVVVESVRVRTAPRMGRTVSGVSVYGASGTVPGTNIARVSHCRLEIGEHQVGILGVDLGRFVVADNVISVVASGRVVDTINDLSAGERALVRLTLFSGLARGTGGGGQTVTIGGQPHTFRSIPQAAPLWAALLPNGFDTMRTFTRTVDSAVRSLVGGTNADPALAGLRLFLRDRIARRRTSVIDQGIVAGGSALGDVIIERNHVRDAVQGIHVATSHQAARLATPDRAGRVMVADNRVQVLIPAEGARARHGIYVGNAVAVTIRSNDLQFDSLAENDVVTTAGVKVFGFVERQISVRENLVQRFPVSVHLFPLLPRGNNQLTQTRLYRVAENVFVQPGSPVLVEGPLANQVVIENNAP